MTERIEYVDVLRGLAVLGVVAIHSSGSGLQFSEESINFNFTVLWRNVLNFSVPLFVTITGFLAANRPIERYEDYMDFLSSRIPRVYVPFLVWSSVWFFFAVVVQNKSVVHELTKLATFQSSGPYYFIALIIQYYLLLPLFKKIANRKGLIFSVFISASVACVIFFCRRYSETRLPLILYAGNFAIWQMFFVLGLCLGASFKIGLSKKCLVVLVLAFYALSCLESYLIITFFRDAEGAVTAVKVSSLMYSFFLIVLLFKSRDVLKSKLLQEIGVISFGIYLTHMFALAFTSRLLSYLCPSLRYSAFFYQISLTALIMLLCILVIFTSRKLFSLRQAQLLGFG